MAKQLHFACSGCGGCCRRVQTAIENTRDIPEFKFPYGYDETGKCDMLNEDNTCKVYNDRPLLCNVEKVAEFLKVNKKKFYRENHKACFAMQGIDNVEERFKLKL